MATERFDAIIVGAGPAGSAAAYTMAKAGLKVVMIERGEFAGAKNIFGGVLYRKQLEDVIPEFWQEAPVERRVVEQRMWLLGKDSVVTMGHRNEAFKEPTNAWTGLRVKFDQWFASKAEQAGSLNIYETVATELIREGDRVVGVRTDREDGDLYANVVVVADGVNSLLGQQLGIHREWNPDQVSLAVKEVIALPKEKILDRFNLEGDEGVTTEFIGQLGGMMGLGFLYTNQETVSFGVGVMVNDLKRTKIRPYELIENVKQHPVLRKLLQGGESKEYAAHLIPEGGLHAVPPLSGNGWVVCGDAAQLVNFVHREGTNLAMTSGLYAAEAIIEAHARGDFGKQALSGYDRRVRESFIHKDLKKYQGLHGLLKEIDSNLFDKLPEALNSAAFQMLMIDGVSKAEKQKMAIKALREAAGGTANLIKLGLKGWRAMNG